jgi:cellulose synthase (UDP-forming)
MEGLNRFRERIAAAAGAASQPACLVAIGVTLVVAVMAVYLCFRLATLSLTLGSAADVTVAVLLFAGELFMGVHAVGYLGSMAKAVRNAPQARPCHFVPHASVPVAVLIPAFNESEDVLEQTLAAVTAMDYPAMTCYVLDDSTKPECQEAAARLSWKYGAQLVHRSHRAGFKGGAINDMIPRLTEPYVALLDADQRPAHSWLAEIVPVLEANRDLALVQAPQVYVNADGLPVAAGASHQQAIFFGYICEGKSYSNAIFCCGSNVVIRRDALLSVEVVVNGRRHYFDETSVTEDFATSVRLHATGWKTAYVTSTHVVGIGPETLGAYFTQQTRWAMGTLAVGLRLWRYLLTNPRMLRPAQWWEYLLSGTYYFVGWVNLIFLTTPIAFLLFGVRAIRTQSEDLYLALFLSYFLFLISFFYGGLRARNYSIRDIWLASALSFITFWTYMRASVAAVLGLKRAFGVTPKAVGAKRIPVMHLLPEFTAFVLSCVGAVVGGVHLWTEPADVAYRVPTVWAAYHAVVLSTLFLHFNQPVVIQPRQRIFARVGTTAI